MGICISIVKTFGVKSNGTHSGGGVNDFLLCRWNFNENTITIIRITKSKNIIPNIHNKLLKVSSFDVWTSFDAILICIDELDVVKLSSFRLKLHETSFTLIVLINGELL